MSTSQSGPNRSSYKPQHWPSDIKYLASQCYHTSASADLRLHLRELGKPNVCTRPVHSSRPSVLIRRITDDKHPAAGQFGLFASRKIPPKCHIIDYIGEVHTDDRLESDYDLSLLRLQDGTSVGVDARTMGNEARFINDYRGVAAKPNAQFLESCDDSGELCMSVRSGSEAIKKGEEILVSYGKGFWRERIPN